MRHNASILLCGASCALAFSAGAFEKIALIDSFDFITCVDAETKAGTEKIVDHVLLTGADTLLWRNQSGSIVRYPSAEEARPFKEPPIDKRRVPLETIHGWARLDVGETNLIAHAFGYISSLGRRPGIHLTFEENHFAAFTFGGWNLDHPQYWCRTYSGTPSCGRSSFAFDEVMAHKMRLLDELLAMNPDTIYMDFFRSGSWTPALEYVEPVLKAWRERYGSEPVPHDAKDERWLKLVSGYMDRYLRAVKAKLAAKNVRFLVSLVKMDLADRFMWERYAVDWKRLAAEGVFDGLVVESVPPDAKDPYGSTRKVYEYVMRNRGKCDVWFHCNTYDYMPGIPTYCRLTGDKPAEAARRLMELARDVGGQGVILECVDWGNYPPEINKVLNEFR
ncbi:MAG: hypothetical protein IKO72_00385 [Kiritimatiellae bacterium]|nr:hypothetical protein [Kiritimatiellia bacterium]